MMPRTDKTLEISLSERTLRDALLRANLPTDPYKIIGRLFLFGSAHEEHQYRVIVGTIQNIEYACYEGLNFYVSLPYYFGYRLVSIRRNMRHGRWSWMIHALPIYLHPGCTSDKERDIFFEGEFQLL